MKLRSIAAIGCFSVFAVSCAHKKIDSDTAKLTPEQKPVVVEKPVQKVVENKGDNKLGNMSLTCVSGSDSRVITLQKGDKRCEVHYTKSGNLNNIAWAEKTPSICDRVFDNVRSNIEKGGFKCTDDGQKTASN